MKNKLLYIFVAILLTACSDEEKLIKPVTVTYTATATVVEGGSLSPASQQITAGEKGVFNLVINNGFSLHSIQGCDGSLNGATYTTGAMHSDCSITPIFKRIQETKSYLASTVTTQGGSLHPANRLIEAGQHGVFEVIIDNGFRLQSIQGCSGSLSGSTYTTGPMQASCTITPVFSADTETPIYLASTATTEGGTLNPNSQQITEGQQGVFEVVADKGFNLQSITGCNGTLNGSTYTTGAMQGHCTITPIFSANIKTYVVNTTASKGGTLNPNSQQITEGQQGVFEVVADKDFSLQSITGCNGTLNGSTYTTGKMQADCHITPVFNINSYIADTITVEGGRLNPVSQTIEAGQQATFEIIVDEYFNLKSVQGCGGTLNGLTYTTAAMHANCSITPTFSIETYVADTVSATGGSLTPGNRSIERGKQGSFEVVADQGFVLLNVEGCNGTLNGTTYTTGIMSANCTITPTFITNAENAIANQNHTLATASELIEFSIKQLTAIETSNQTTVKQLYQGIGSTITWNPTHDSITFSTFMPENTFTVLPSNVDGSGNVAISGLVMAGEQQSQRYATMAGNLFSVNRSAETDILLKNLLDWLTQGEDKVDGFNVITAQMPSLADSHYFRHNEHIRIWLNEFYPTSHSINQANSCDYAELISCIDAQKPDLIILSDIDRQSLGYEGIKSAMVKAKAMGIPLLLSNYQRTQSPMLAPLYLEMGVATSGNYWTKRQTKDLNISEIIKEDASLVAVKSLLYDLDAGNFNTSVLNDCTGNFLNYCRTDAFTTAFRAGADWYRNNAIAFDTNSLNIFAKNNFDLMKAGLLLADKYRSKIDYPITYDEHTQWQQALFADWLISYIRPNNLTQPDLGQFIQSAGSLSKNTPAHYTYPKTITEHKTISVPYSGQWTTTGWYALPGQTIKLTRSDLSSATVKVKLNYHRPNTNRVYQNRIYRAPLELMQQRLTLAANKPLEFSTPYGGPIYLHISGSKDFNIKVTAEGVTKHPTITDFSDAQQILTFNELLENTELPHIDLRTDGAEQHLRRDRFTNAIKGNFPNVNALLNSIANDHINNLYGLAGFKLQGKALTESLPTDVLSTCQGLFGSDCIDNAIHTRTMIQHANYDQNAHCGAGCSGNPWDAGWNINPTGWGDNHELGHNLQTNRLNVQYATEANRDNWTGYSSRAGENSNNIFPYYVAWKTHYIRDGNTNEIKGGMNNKDLFYVFMSDAANIKDNSGQRLIYDANCKLISSGVDRYEGLWESNAYAIHNSYRMTFYIQMAFKAHGMVMNDGTTLANGFNIFTLLYQHHRIFGKYANNATNWEANRTKLGFSLFPYNGNNVYGGRAIANIPGNDFMLVSLSKLTGKDWRSHFDMFGLRYSSLAAAQVVENATNGAVPMGMYQLELEYPPANVSENLTFIPMSLTDGTTLWKGQTSPTQCNN